jgi:hypothetical protein
LERAAELKASHFQRSKMAFSDSKLMELYIITASLSGVAILVQFVVIFTYARFKALRKKSYEMVFILAISSVFANLGYLIQHKNVTGSIICEFVLSLFIVE